MLPSPAASLATSPARGEVFAEKPLHTSQAAAPSAVKPLVRSGAITTAKRGHALLPYTLHVTPYTF
jgi:hypothetical protein